MDHRPGSRFLDALRSRELAAVRWLIHPIPDRAAAERALVYGQRAGLFAILLRTIYALYPAGDALPDAYDFAVLAAPQNLVLLAAYLYVFVDGFRRWQATLAAALAFAADSFGLVGEPAGEITLARLLLGLYVLRCFAIGVRAGRRLAAPSGGGSA